MMQIVAAFPGTGKSMLARRGLPGLTIRDCDSAAVDKAGFPGNYVSRIRDGAAGAQTGLLLVSTHDSLRAALRAAGLAYLLAFPRREDKPLYLRRYRERGDDDAFCRRMDGDWERFIASCEADPSPHLRLGPGDTLAVALERWIPTQEALR